MLYYKLWHMKGLAMKKLFFLVLCFSLVAVSPELRAENLVGMANLGNNQRPKIATEQEVALIYHRLSEQVPDFRAWARASKEYLEASALDREAVEARKAEEIKTAYQLLSFSEPIVVRLRVNLSAYSQKNKGYIVKNIEEQTFFKFKYAGRNYAIVPTDLINYQFLGPMPDDSYDKNISRHRAIGSSYTLMIYLRPNWADKPDVLTEIDGERFHVISAPVSHVELFDVGETVMLWGNNSKSFDTAQSSELLNLKQ